MIDQTIPEVGGVATGLGLAGLDDKQLVQFCGAATRDLLVSLPEDLHRSEEPANFTVIPQAARAWRSPPDCC
jgi:hypothetical protein